jgi:sugar phosphate isomerase/epimerase
MLKLGVSSYSYWHFTPQKTAIEYVIDQAAALGLVGVEVIHQQLESEDNAYLQRLKRHAFQNGVTLYNLGTSQDFVWDHPERRAQNVSHTKHCINLAHELGSPSIRVNAGWWRREGSPGLTETKGWATPWEGASEEDGFNWAIDGLTQCLGHAERLGVMLLLENHWGLTTTAKGMLRILEAVNSPWLRAILDTGNFYYDSDMYSAMEQLLPWVDLLHAKTYPGGGKVFTIPIDYARVFTMLASRRFQGYVTLEMEGQEAPETAVPGSIRELTRAWAQATQR